MGRMPRLIDADNFLKRVLPICIIPNELKKNMGDEPTVDAVPVVRCKDCEYGKFISDTKGCVWCTCYEIHKSLNGFCEYGEWKK